MRGIIPLMLFGLLILGMAFGLTRDPSVIPSEMVDRPMPAFVLPSLYEDKLDITEAVFDGEISLLNVFGSWCSACVTEHPKLVEIGESTDIQLVGIDWRDTRKAGQAWLRRYDNPYDAVIFDEASVLAIDLGVTGAPETFLVDTQGRIRFKHVGVITNEVWDQEFLPRIAQIKVDGA